MGDFFHPELHMARLEWEKIEDARPRLARAAYFWEQSDDAGDAGES